MYNVQLVSLIKRFSIQISIIRDKISLQKFRMHNLPNVVELKVVELRVSWDDSILNLFLRSVIRKVTTLT